MEEEPLALKLDLNDIINATDDVILNLLPNYKLTAQYFTIEYSSDKIKENVKEYDHCFFKGSVVGYPNSAVSLSTCKHGLHGVISGLQQKRIYVEPFWKDVLNMAKRRRRRRKKRDTVR